MLLEFLWLCAVTIAVTGALMQAKILCWYVHTLQYQYKQSIIIIIFIIIVIIIITIFMEVLEL